MSSISFSIARKRSHSPDFSDSSDSEDEAPPLKLKRKNSGTKVPLAFTLRLKNLVSWISDLPVKDYFKMAVKTGSTLPEEEIVIDDDDDDDIIVLDEDDDGKENPFVQRLEQLRKHKVSNSQRLGIQPEVNGSPRYQTRGSEVICYYDSRGGIHRSKNGTRSGTLVPKYYGNGSCNLRTIQSDKTAGIISNPPTDIEVYLEAETKSTTPEPELEIIEDGPPTRKAKAPSPARPIRVSARSGAVKSVSSHPVPSHSRLHSAKSPYTANELLRLQEKEQYQALLEKYINGNHNRKSSGKPKLNEVQVNPVGFGFSGEHFKKEVLQQPISSFIEKYCKPCRLVPSAKKSPEPEEIIIDDEEEEEEEVDIKLPKYKPKYHHKPNFFSPEWINELRCTVNTQTEERLKIVHQHERAVERYKKERLLEKLNENIGLSEPAEPEFPDLTPEMDEAVDKALVGDPDAALCKTGTDTLFRKDIETLIGYTWLNDGVITSYLDLILARSKQEGYPSLYVFNTFFYTSLKNKGYQAVRRWTRRVDIFSFDLNFIPLHLGIHWCLAVIDHRSKKICYYDSMGTAEETCLDLLHEYLCNEHEDKKGKPLDPSTYTCEVMKDIPQQMNGSDCGMFTLKYAEYISRGAELTFSQKHMAYFRRRMIYELITLKLL